MYYTFSRNILFILISVAIYLDGKEKRKNYILIILSLSEEYSFKNGEKGAKC